MSLALITSCLLVLNIDVARAVSGVDVNGDEAGDLEGRTRAASLFLSQVVVFRLPDEADVLARAAEVAPKSDTGGCNTGDGKYRNICGECVGGDVTEKDESFGADSCGVCGGRDLCRRRPGGSRPPGGEGSSVDTEEEELDDEGGEPPIPGSTSRMYPRLLDLAVAPPGRTMVRLMVSPALAPTDDLTCTVGSTGTELLESEAVSSADGTAVSVMFDLPQTEGRFSIDCNTTSAEHSGKLVIVDSRKLVPLGATPDHLLTEVQTQVRVRVSNMWGALSLVCFARPVGGGIAWAASTPHVSGNALSSSVDCGAPVLLTHPGTGGTSKVELGVAYTFDAVNVSKTLTVDLVKPTPCRPRAKKAAVGEDLTTVRVEYDANPEPPAQDALGRFDCRWAFARQTVDAFGKGAACRASGDSVIVTIGQGSSLGPGSSLAMSTGQKLRLDVPRELSDPVTDYQVESPRVVCAGSATLVRAISGRPGAVASYEWDLGFSIPDGTAGAAPQRSSKQRRNLLVWLGVRQSMKEWAKASPDNSSSTVTLNSSLLVEGVDYVVSVVAVSRSGLRGARVSGRPIRLVGGSGAATLRLFCAPPVVRPTDGVTFEAAVQFCSDGSSSSPDQEDTMLQYAWTVEMIAGNNSPSAIVSSGLDSGGPVFAVPRGVFKHPGSSYIVGVVVSNTSTSSELARAECNLKCGEVDEKSVKVRLMPSKASIGTGHHLELDATSNTLAAVYGQAGVKYSWECTQEDGKVCTSPGRDAKPVLDGSTRTGRLRIPPKSLPVGRYVFRVNASSPGERFTVSATSTVLVVRGDPPVIRMVVPPSATPGTVSRSGPHLVMATLTSDQFAAEGSSCLVSWSAVSGVGLEVAPVSDQEGVFKRIVGMPGSDTIVEFPLNMPPGSLRAGSKYGFILRADCGPDATSSMMVHLETTEELEINQFKVVPASGVSLETEFSFLPVEKMVYPGAVYRFGYRMSSSTVHFLQSAHEPTSTGLVLPAGDVTTVVRLCDSRNICSQLLGPNVTVVLPQTVTQEVIEKIRRVYGRKLYRGEYDEALGWAQVLLKTAKAVDAGAHAMASSVTATELVRNMDSARRRLKDSGGETGGSNAVELLATASSTVTLLAEPDNVLVSLLELRNAIREHLGRASGNDMEMTPTPGDGGASVGPPGKRRRRSTGDDPDLKRIKALLTTSSLVILGGLGGEKTRVVLEMNSLMKSLPEFAAQLCAKIEDGGLPMYAGSGVAELSVQRLRTGQSLRHEINLPECLGQCHKTNSTAQAVMTKNFLDRFKNDKSGLCLGGFYLGRDLLQESSGRPYAHGHARWSGVYGLEVMIYDANGGAVAMNISGTSEGSDRKKRGALVILRMPLWSSPPPPGHQLQCASWSSAVGWTADKCRTAKQTTVRGRQAIECKCPLYAKYFSVFARPPLSKDTKPGGGGPGTSGGETTSSTGPPKLDYTYTADFVIEADFQKTVRPVKQEFESSAKSQLNKQFKLPKFSTVGTSPLAGKTLVEVTMWGGPGELSGQALTGGTSDVSGAIGRLARALATGTLVIEVPGGKETVRVPQQTLRVTQRIQGRTGGSARPLAVFSVSVAIGLTIVGVIAVAVVVSRCRRSTPSHRLVQTPPKGGLLGPRYLRLQDELSIETIEKAIARNGDRLPPDLNVDMTLAQTSDNGRRRRLTMASLPNQQVGQLPGTPAVY